MSSRPPRPLIHSPPPSPPTCPPPRLIHSPPPSPPTCPPPGQQRSDQDVPGGGAVQAAHHAALPVWLATASRLRLGERPGRASALPSLSSGGHPHSSGTHSRRPHSRGPHSRGQARKRALGCYALHAFPRQRFRPGFRVWVQAWIRGVGSGLDSGCGFRPGFRVWVQAWIQGVGLGLDSGCGFRPGFRVWVGWSFRQQWQPLARLSHTSEVVGALLCER